jgi:L-ascorbate metabolism protein UlaG (beta-lactamase superfamily)
LKGTRITWLGHATVLVETAKGTNILIDPFIAQNPKYPKDFELPSKIDLHSANSRPRRPYLGRSAGGEKHGSTVVAIYELAAYVAGKGVERTIGMNLGGTVQLDDVAATMVEARHSSGAQDEHGTHYVGVAAGYVLTIADGPVLYHAGRYGCLRRYETDRELYSPRWQCFRSAATSPWDRRKQRWPRTYCSQKWCYRCTLVHSHR